jgi:phospholipid-transporting ATPase
MSNLYFLLLMIMQVIPSISDTGGIPTLALPLGFVVLLSMVKDIYEDLKRH